MAALELMSPPWWRSAGPTCILCGLSLPIAMSALVGCAPRVPVPARGPHTGDTPLMVPYAPPAARPEVVPPPPRQDEVWVDGQWIWDGEGYRWRPGSWVLPAAGSYYAPPAIVRRVGGELLYFTGSWHLPVVAAHQTPASSATAVP